MRKRIWLVVLFLMGVLVVVFGISAAFAYGNTDPGTPEPNRGEWDMADHCPGAGGMMGGYGSYHIGLTDAVTLQRVAGTLGLTYEQLTVRLAQGETIAQVAQAQGVASSLVVTTILAPESEILQVRVKYGYLTEAQAQTTLEQVRYWVEQAMTQSLADYYGATGSPATNYGSGSRVGGGMMGGGMMGNSTTGNGMTGNGMMGGGTMDNGMMGGGSGGMMGNGMMGNGSGGMMGNW